MPPSADTLSPLRGKLCSRENALRVARRMTRAGIAVIVVATGERLQPWRVVEADAASRPEILACA
ncbi:MAG: hypothetical protein ABW128_05880 [Rhizorhabdus sp.]